MAKVKENAEEAIGYIILERIRRRRTAWKAMRTMRSCKPRFARSTIVIDTAAVVVKRGAGGGDGQWPVDAPHRDYRGRTYTAKDLGRINRDPEAEVVAYPPIGIMRRAGSTEIPVSVHAQPSPIFWPDYSDPNRTPLAKVPAKPWTYIKPTPPKRLLAETPEIAKVYNMLAAIIDQGVLYPILDDNGKIAGTLPINLAQMIALARKSECLASIVSQLLDYVIGEPTAQRRSGMVRFDAAKGGNWTSWPRLVKSTRGARPEKTELVAIQIDKNLCLRKRVKWIAPETSGFNALDHHTALEAGRFETIDKGNYESTGIGRNGKIKTVHVNKSITVWVPNPNVKSGSVQGDRWRGQVILWRYKRVAAIKAWLKIVDTRAWERPIGFRRVSVANIKPRQQRARGRKRSADRAIRYVIYQFSRFMPKEKVMGLFERYSVKALCNVLDRITQTAA